MGFGSLQSFEFMQRTAKMFSHSSMVPTAYRAVVEKGYGANITVTENLSALPNCIIALNMSQRMNADPLMIMQNLHVIEGRPSWSSQFIIASINSCGKFAPLRFHKEAGVEIEATCTTFEWENNKKKAVITKTRVINSKCIAWTVERGTDIPRFSLEEIKAYGSIYQACKAYGVPLLESTQVSLEMAVNEGWYGKNGSKWQTMSDLMLQYRSAAFFGRIYAPELLMGLPAAEETQDVIDVSQQPDGTYAVSEAPAAPAQAAPLSKSEARAAAARDTSQATDATPAATATSAPEQQDPPKDLPKTQATSKPTASAKADPQTGEIPATINPGQVKYLQAKIKSIELPDSAVDALLMRVGAASLADLNLEQFATVKAELLVMGA